MKKPWQFRATGRGAVEILLYDVIGEDFFGEGTTAKAFAEELAAAGGLTSIHLKVNSPGGNVFDGVSIYNALLSHSATVTAQVVGLAASIASVIIMAASEISMGEGSMIMIHNPYAAVIGGDAGEMRKMASTLDKVKDSMITAYRRHTKKTKAEIATLMDAETWLSANEAVANGFAEEVVDPEESDDLAAACDPRILAKFRHVPQPFAARFASGVRSELSRGITDSERSRLAQRIELLWRLPDAGGN
jgi:ATP-dependent Clp endopeptidase proteolytic subunit ClpP